MTYEYEILEQLGTKVLKRTDEDGNIAWVPMDESNSDYQRYLHPDLENGTIS
jgi:hypothetical protein